MKIDFMPLTWIKSPDDLSFQIRNTLIIKDVLSKFKEVKELKQLLEKTQYGFTASASEFGMYKLLRITDLKSGKVNWENVPFCDGNCEKYLLKEKDIVIARTGNNKSFLIKEVPDNAVFASYLIRLEVNEKLLLPEYLYIFLNSYVFWSQVIEMQTGTAIPNVNAEKLKKLIIPYCSIEEQKKIIDNIFDKNLKEEINKIEKFLENKEELSKNVSHDKAILSSLRQSILSEAVSGKLVPQNKEDEPAKELLRKIKKEKENLIKEGKIKKGKELPVISDDEIPYDLPKGWIWMRLGDVCDVKGGKRIPKGYLLQDVPTKYIYIRVTDMKDGTIKDNKLKYISEDIYQLIKQYTISKDNLYITIAGTIGEVGFVPSKFDNMNLTENAAKIINYGVDKSFLKLILSSKFAKDQFLDKVNQMAQPKLALMRILTTKIPLPPLPEQHRIVEKVDSLMGFCDELELRIKENKINSEGLMSGVLSEVFGIGEDIHI